MRVFQTDKNGDGRKHGMFSRVRRHINAATVVAVFAMIFAMTGGAFALSSNSGSATNAIVAKSKAKAKAVRGPAGPRGVTGPAGPAGAQGAQGPAGAQGPKGETGAAGTNGTPGAKGETGPQGPQGKEGKEGPEGPAGPAGTTGFTKTLPSGETETGTWDVGAGKVEETEGKQFWFVPISFSIPLKASLKEVHYIKSGEHTTACPGSAELPKAGLGQFCLYEGFTAIPEENGVLGEIKVPLITSPESGGLPGTGTAGTLITVIYKGPAPANEQLVVDGSWAVTAP